MDKTPKINMMSAKEFISFFAPNMSEEKLEELAQEAEQRVKDRHTVTEDEKRFREILGSVGREGTDALLKFLWANDFFYVPASVHYHSNWKGGLVNHSLKVYDCAMRLREEMLKQDPSLEDQLKKESVAVAALLHDVCKHDEYKIKADGSPAHVDIASSLFPVGGHGDKSAILVLLVGYHLKPEEILAIRWHMGAKYIKDPKEKAFCEEAKKYPLVRLIIRADHEAATTP